MQLSDLVIRVSGKSQILKAVVPAVKEYCGGLLISEAENQLYTSPNSTFKARNLKLNEVSFRTIKVGVVRRGKQDVKPLSVKYGLLVCRAEGGLRCA
jgi:hypothetical protein